ncbi:unnamed protein product [Dovyalis caffra]|uniref:Maturase K n=1 Tax=Dovyalis caffra TaxID=77055 RepID=A0AAV1RNR5_9ROSI|nr:unnamed protein product [Dovyalis caffra]
MSSNSTDADEYEDNFINDDDDHREIKSPSTVYSSEGCMVGAYPYRDSIYDLLLTVIAEIIHSYEFIVTYLLGLPLVEEISNKKKHTNGKGSHKRLRKKFQFSEFDGEDKLHISFSTRENLL